MTTAVPAIVCVTTARRSDNEKVVQAVSSIRTPEVVVARHASNPSLVHPLQDATGSEEGFMSTYRGYEGMWATYDYEVGPYLIKTYREVTDAARECAAQGYGKVVFLRQDMEFQESIDWFLQKDNRQEEWNKIRKTVSDAFHIAKEANATNPEQLFDIVTNRIWMDYLNHETGMSCASTPTDPAEKQSEAGPGTT